MKKKLNQKWVTHKELFEKWENDPEFINEYNKLETEFQIAQIVIDLRVKYKITQEELANRIGSGQAVISRLESGNTNTSIALLQRIARAVDDKFTITIQ